jgi:hypothetical protein
MVEIFPIGHSLARIIGGQLTLQPRQTSLIQSIFQGYTMMRKNFRIAIFANVIDQRIEKLSEP